MKRPVNLFRRLSLTQQVFALILLFLAFVFIWQTNWEWKGINAETIQEKIGTSIELPEGFPELSDVIPISESEM